MEQPSIYFFGHLFQEPVTALTDLILCLSCLLFGLKVGKSHSKYWSYFFYFVTIASLFGALGHTLFENKNNYLMLISRLANVIAVFLASVASIEYLKIQEIKLLFNVFSLILMVTSVIMICILNRFWIVIWDAVIGLGIITGGIQLFLASRKDRGHVFIIFGILTQALTIYIHSNRYFLSKWFNQNDLSHIILIFGFYLMSRGILKLKNYAPNSIFN